MLQGSMGQMGPQGPMGPVGQPGPVGPAVSSGYDTTMLKLLFNSL